jgi:hypothetical protein
MFTSYRTTLLGLATIIGAISSAAIALTDGDPLTQPDWAILTAAITTGLGLIQARDNKVSSEAAKAK